MKQFVRKIILYCSLIAFIAFIITYLSTFWYWQSRTPIIKKNLLDHSGAKISVVLGSSHALHGINTQLIGHNYYNMASTSQGLYEDYEILKHTLLSKNVQAIILPISYFSNHTDLSTISILGERTRIFDYEKAYAIEYPHHFDYYKLQLNKYAQALMSLYKKRETSSGNFDGKGNLITSCIDNTGDFSDTTSAFKRHNEQADFSKRNPYLDSIIHLCSIKNIKLNIVVFPFSSGYNDEITRNKNHQGFEGFLASIKQQQSEKLMFLDCRNLITKNESFYFIDADHLSACGRDSLSRYLNNIILH